MPSKQDLIEQLQLEKHPEGGYYKETYRSKITIKNESLPSEFTSVRSASTCIYFMLTSEEFSAFHKVNQDEIWHFYLGSRILLHMISPQGKYSKIKIGTDFSNGEIPQFVVPAQHWFAAEVTQPKSFALVGCTVAPGFDFKDFKLAKRKELQQKFPKHQALISRLTR
ncbi:cupin domain-containing protein [Psychroflexus sp. ALD_RP9]|uniref:cupin domain-containing protein n=1 Tax=Psychroflexus sp. ALD_RP9 TaxID=2777186 RepID=UPI001A8E990F|nr:cupin domain-containing protein [Psychroflexus sp. ALD_RP9]QSS96776.1 cupin domain-containing protein [Psychroflexus sp. ALD_RP9]